MRITHPSLHKSRFSWRPLSIRAMIYLSPSLQSGLPLFGARFAARKGSLILGGPQLEKSPNHRGNGDSDGQGSKVIQGGDQIPRQARVTRR